MKKAKLLKVAYPAWEERYGDMVGQIVEFSGNAWDGFYFFDSTGQKRDLKKYFYTAVEEVDTADIGLSG